MKVKTSSWRYSLIYDYSPFYPAATLCGYFWQVTGWGSLILASIPTVVTGLVLAPLFVFYGDQFSEWIDTLPLLLQIWLIMSSAIGGLLWVIGIGMTVVIGGAAVGEFAVTPVINKIRYSELTEPGLFRQWLKAKHDKICPLIDYVDD